MYQISRHSQWRTALHWGQDTNIQLLCRYSVLKKGRVVFTFCCAIVMQCVVKHLQISALKLLTFIALFCLPISHASELQSLLWNII